eukprot:Skav233194  [mRNA]  locus=scaffold24:362821:365349:- [translate_table: standard]
MMAMAAEVAEVAYQQGRISPNVRRALSNATYYHEAVLDAGLPWSLLQTQQHINQTALALSSSLQLLSSNTSVIAEHAKEHFVWLGFANESKHERFGARIWNTEMEQFLKAATEKSNLVDAMANAVAEDYSSGMGVKDYTSHFLGAATAIIGLTMPVTSAVGGIVAFFVLDMLDEFGVFGKGDGEVLYEKIMKEMGAYVDKSIVMANVNYIRSNLESLAEELTWMPSMLGGWGAKAFEIVMASLLQQAGVAANEAEAKNKVKNIPDAEKHSMLMFLITCQHDAAKISYAIRNNEHCQERETSQSPRWVTSVAPLAEFVVMLQTTLISGIGKHDMVQERGLAGIRIQHVLTGGDKSWTAWTRRCIPRVAEFEFKLFLK